MQKSYWYLLCEIIFTILAWIFAYAEHPLTLWLAGMGFWMLYKGLREAWKEEHGKPFYCKICREKVDEDPKLHAFKHWIS